MRGVGTAVLVIAICLLATTSGRSSMAVGPQAIADVLDDFHDAASKADGERYFAHFHDDAVFLGTDATERWTLAEFRAFAEPYFDEGRGWSYEPRERHISIAHDGSFAWFDELLHSDKYGTCRGTGVLIRGEREWKIAQYSLSLPVPNDLALEVVALIRTPRKGDGG